MYLSEEQEKVIVDLLVQELNPKFIYLFGSFAKGEGRIDSDIDLAVYVTDEVSGYSLFLLAGKLSMLLKRDVQIVDLKDISTVFAAQIVGTKKVLHCDDEILMANYDIRVFKDYAKLNEERKVVLDAIKKDGKIYG